MVGVGRKGEGKRGEVGLSNGPLFAAAVPGEHVIPAARPWPLDEERDACVSRRARLSLGEHDDEDHFHDDDDDDDDEDHHHHSNNNNNNK